MAKGKDKVLSSEPGNKTEDFLDQVKKELDLAVDADRHNRREAVDCLNFSMGGTAQWDEYEVNKRKRRKRVILTINQCPRYIKHLTGEMRQNRASIKVHPADSFATKELALIRQGLINNIIYQSDFETILDNAAKQLVTCGYGAWRVLTKYEDANPFRQEIYLEEIENPLMVYPDPYAKDFFYRDARWIYLLTKISKKEFKEEYPNALMPGQEFKANIGPGGSYEHWYDKEGAVTIAERYAVVPIKKTVCLMNSGEVLLEDEAKDTIKEWKDTYQEKQKLIEDIQDMLQPAGGGTPGIAPSMPGPMSSPPPLATSPSVPKMGANVPGMGTVGAAPALAGGSLPGQSPVMPPALPQMPMPPSIPPKPRIIETKEVDVPEVRYWKLTGHEILVGGLEGKKVAGKFIPIVFPRGEKTNIEGKNYIKGLLNDTRDPLRLFNWWITNAAEHVAVLSKAPWVATQEQLKGFEKYYAQSNEENYPYLAYNVDPDTPGTKPTREGSPNPPVAVFAEIDRAERLSRLAFGMSGATTGDLDQLSGRASGAAIGERQKPAQTINFVFQDNLNKAVLYTGQIIEAMMPEIYDTERDVRLRSDDGSSRFVPINTTLRNALEKVSFSPDRYVGVNPLELQKQIAKTGSGDETYNMMNRGKYETIIKVGPSYATQRQESADMLLKLTNSNPKQMSLVTDIVLKNMDFLDADEAAERIKKTLPPGLAKPKPGELPSPPMPPPPQAQIAMTKMQVEQQKIQVQLAKLQVEKIKALKLLQGEKSEIRSMLLDLLREVYSGPQQR